jgi:DNA topoisomerase-1
MFPWDRWRASFSDLKTTTSKRMSAKANSVSDPAAAANDAGLYYVNDDRLGYRRRTNGNGFEYLDTETKRIRDRQRLLRIKRLAIPPAWTDVWICPSPNGHIQATGRDIRGRKQYRYHDRWREVRDENKFGRLAEFAEALPNIRRRITRNMKLNGLPRQKILAAIVRLLDRTFMRIGNEEYARFNKSFGLTTMRDRHVTVKGSHLLFRFRGKSGREHEVGLTDQRIAKIVSNLQDLPGQNLFQYVNGAGEARDITSQDVNDYLGQISGNDFTAKDFRTWAGTLLTAIGLSAQPDFESKKQAKANIKNAVSAAAEILGNTPAICRKCYVHPAVIEAYLNRTPIAGVTSARKSTRRWDLPAAEKAVLKFLRTQRSKDRSGG